ncbi:unnamed protein product [Spirodela intermedia]|uniref:Uncharacterized protein n=1 Tax=Spirodela intermedia TaxID=51605 RepID=A0ABN7E8M1_SPIIN|nr:unnamed protein product [Spirodela intermedia]
MGQGVVVHTREIAGEGLSNQVRWIIGENLVNTIHGALIANPSSKSSPIDRRTSRRREEDDPPGDESPPPESVLDLDGGGAHVRELHPRSA